MAGRIRSIKPEILDDEVTASLSHLEYRIFTGTWLIADDYGNLRADPDYVRAQIVWARRDTTTEEVAAALRQLVELELVQPYTVRGQSYLHILGWQKHQKVDKPGKPRMPGPTAEDHSAEQNPRETPARLSRDSRETPATDLRPPTIDQDLEREPRAPARDPTTPAPPTPPAAPNLSLSGLPDGWGPEPSDQNSFATLEAASAGVDVEAELRKWRDHCAAKPRPPDLNAAWRIRLSRATEYARLRAPKPEQRRSPPLVRERSPPPPLLPRDELDASSQIAKQFLTNQFATVEAA